MIALLHGELFKLVHRRMARVLVLLVAGGPVVAYLLLSALPEGGGTDVDNLRLAHVPAGGMFVVYQVAMVAAVAMAASSIGSEFSSGTIRTLLPRSAGRSAFLTAKAGSLVVFVVVIVITGLLAVLAGSALATLLRGLDGSVGAGFAGDALLSVLKVVLAVLPYCSLALLVALWTRSTAAGIAVPIVFFYVEVLLTPLFTSTDVLSWLPDALIYTNITALLGVHAIVSATAVPAAGQAAAVLAAWAAGLVALALGRFLSRDVY